MAKQGYVYIAQAENGLYKIGKTVDISRRERNLRAQSPLDINLLHFFDCRNPHIVEIAIHRILAEYRHHGEWFDLDKKDIDWLMGLSEDDYDYLIDGGYKALQRPVSIAAKGN